jgi:putative redox protein
MRADAGVRAEWRGALLRFVSGAGDAPAVVVDGDGVTGPSPMQLLLHSLAGCTGADVVDILSKMRVALDGLTVGITATRAPDPPRRYTAIHIAYRARVRAVALSHEKYCSVLHSLREDIEIRFDVDAS